MEQLVPLLRSPGGVPVDEGLAAPRQRLLDAQLIHGHHAAPGHGVLLGDQLQHLGHGFLDSGTVIALHVPLLQGLYQLRAGLVIHHFLRAFH